jgi:hypothetical protein
LSKAKTSFADWPSGVLYIYKTLFYKIKPPLGLGKII